MTLNENEIKPTALEPKAEIPEESQELEHVPELSTLQLKPVCIRDMTQYGLGLEDYS